jgi:hypothetical protein
LEARPPDIERGAARASGGIELDPATMGLNQTFAQGQPNPGMFARLGRERLKDPKYSFL